LPWNWLVPDLMITLDSALEIAEFGGGVVGDQLEFLDGIHVGLIRNQVIGGEVVVRAIQQEVVGFLAVAVDIGTAAAGGTLAAVEARRIGRGDARDQEGERYRVAADQRRVIDLVGVDHRAHLRGIGLQNRSFSGNGDAFADGADLERNIHAGALVDFEDDIGIDVGFEALRFHFELIPADRYAREGVDAVFIGFGWPDGLAVQISGGDRCIQHGCAGGVGNTTGDAGAGLLRHQRQSTNAHCGDDN